MIRGLFITGTDTGVGKTVVAAALMHRYRQELKLCYWKPIQTGIEQDDDTAVVRNLGSCTDEEILDQGVRLKRAVSPHLAAKLSGKRISIEQTYRILLKQSQKVSWIIEGAGGALVPINETEQMVDLARMFSLPVIVVARTTLGTINHTLLTLEALRRRALIIAGVVLVGEPNENNRQAIESYGLVSALGELPFLSNLTAEDLRRWAQIHLDEEGVLLAHLQLAHHATLDFKL
jgi:dethiobiotin synthetase